ncbi:alpha/beta hydrolase [Spirosoma aerolatum]|uniref:alpha/beta hydrolase n=1 Tax=Spirosoma aerolatum TaxID=1211326 RepID=UPI0009AD1E60|nr:alpha/beta hydrolase-fold protein [Spirosoma aerolatum]
MSRFFTTELAEQTGLQLITVKSNALKRRADLTVFQPKGSEHSLNIPVVILLHGVYGSHWAWTAKGAVHRTAQVLIDQGVIKPMLLVMPSDGLFGDGSGYVPHRQEDYEAWVIDDVIGVIREQFATVSTASQLFITGLSMGGFGALRLGAKYPHLFSAFSGLSSITHFTQLSQFVQDFSALQEAAIEQDGVLDWMLTHKTSLPPFRFDCGTDDNLIDANRALHQQLLAHQIPHTYDEFTGGHSWDYWQEHIGQTLRFFNQHSSN